MDGYIDDDDDGVDDDDIDGGDAVGVFRFFLLAPGGGGGGDGERDGEVQSVSRSLVEVAEGTEKAAVPGSRLESWMNVLGPATCNVDVMSMIPFLVWRCMSMSGMARMEEGSLPSLHTRR